MRRFAWIVVTGIALSLAQEGRPQIAGRVEVHEVKYDGLKEAVLKNRGKVVVVDFWSTTCIPCKKAFPHLVELQNRHVAKGLVVVSVSVDEIEQCQTRMNRFTAVSRDLSRFEASGLTNLILDENWDVLGKKLRIESIPCTYVFNRQGQWTQFGGNSDKATPPFDPVAVERLVVELLQEK